MNHFKVALLAAGALVVASSANAAENFRLSHMFAADSLPGEAANKFAALVAEKGGGDFKVTVIPAGALGDEKANLQQLKTGSIDMALTGDLVISSMVRPYMIVSMPFIYDNPQHSIRVFNGEIGKEINGFLLKNHGIRALAWQYVGTREVTANKPVRDLAGLKGLKMRLPGAEMWVKTWEKTGVDIASIAFTELYLALQTGTVSAEENPPNFIRAQKFNEVQKYVMMTNHVPQMQVFFMNAARYDGLDAKTRGIVDAAAKETTDFISKKAMEMNESDLQWLVTKGGMERIDIDLTGIQDLIASVPREIGGEDAVKLYQRIRALAK